MLPIVPFDTSSTDAATFSVMRSGAGATPPTDSRSACTRARESRSLSPQLSSEGRKTGVWAPSGQEDPNTHEREVPCVGEQYQSALELEPRPTPNDSIDIWNSDLRAENETQSHADRDERTTAARTATPISTPPRRSPPRFFLAAGARALGRALRFILRGNGKNGGVQAQHTKLVSHLLPLRRTNKHFEEGPIATNTLKKGRFATYETHQAHTQGERCGK